MAFFVFRVGLIEIGKYCLCLPSKNQNLYQESKSELVDLQKIISLIQEIKKNGNFLEEEIELINKTIVENK